MQRWPALSNSFLPNVATSPADQSSTSAFPQHSQVQASLVTTSSNKGMETHQEPGSLSRMQNDHAPSTSSQTSQTSNSTQKTKKRLSSKPLPDKKHQSTSKATTKAPVLKVNKLMSVVSEESVLPPPLQQQRTTPVGYQGKPQQQP